MTKSQLIAELEQFDDDDEVMIWSEFGNIQVKKVEKTDEGVVLS